MKKHVGIKWGKEKEILLRCNEGRRKRRRNGRRRRGRVEEKANRGQQ